MSHLIADALSKDPRLKKNKKEILELVREYAKTLTTIRPPLLELKNSYDETIKTFGGYRGIDLFYPYLGSGIGNGTLVELADGSVKYDFISGIGVHFGHSHPTLLEAALNGAMEDIEIHGNLQQNRSSFLLTERLIKESGMDHCILTSSGAMANENALKLAFQKRNPAHRVFAFEHCFAGRTLALAQITDKAAFREGLPSVLGVDYLPFYDWREPENSTKRVRERLSDYLARYPGQHACMLFELIQGEGGCYPGTPEFFIEIMKHLREAHIPIIVDEVQTFGRTERLFAFQSFGLQDYVDIVTVGKLLHTCATLFKKTLRPKSGLISQTYTAASTSIHAALAILDSLLNEDYLGPQGKNKEIRKAFVAKLQQIADRYPDQFEGPFGHGLMIAATPFKGEREKVLKYVRTLFEAGVIVFTAGTDPTRIRFLVPAGGITFADIDQVALILEEVLIKCLTI